MSVDLKQKVLMIGPARDVQGGVSAVVNSYFEAGLDSLCDLKYIGTVKDTNKLGKIINGIYSYGEFCWALPKYDIVHVHMASRMSFVRKSFFIKKAKRKNKKVVIHLHGAEFALFFNKECSHAKKEKIREVFSLADRVVALSEEWKEFLASNICNEDKIDVIYNSVEIPEYGEKEYDNLNVLFLGRLGERKGVFDLIKVVPEIIQKYPDVRFILGGDGEIEKVKLLCEKIGVIRHFQFLGWVRDKEKDKWLKKCSIYLLPTHNEGMPISVLEAMSYGCATISTRVGGIPQMIQHKENGLLFEAHDLVGLKESLGELLSSSELRRNLGSNAKMTVESKFNIRNTVKNLITLYKYLK